MPVRPSFPQYQDTPDEKSQFHNGGYNRDGIQTAVDKRWYSAQDEQAKNDQHGFDIRCFVHFSPLLQ
jgi:hypothetical protein